MLPVVDKPLIQYAVEEAVAAGITEMVFVTGRNKRAIEDHFDKSYELEAELEATRQGELLDRCAACCPTHATASTCASRSRSGSAMRCCARSRVVGDEPFAVILADDLMDAQRRRRSRRWSQFRQHEKAARCSACRTCRATRPSTASSASTRRRATARCIAQHRREAGARAGAVEPRRGRPLCADAAHLRAPAHSAAGRGRRDPAHRRDRGAAAGEQVLAFRFRASVSTAAASSAI